MLCIGLCYVVIHFINGGKFQLLSRAERTQKESSDDTATYTAL